VKRPDLIVQMSTFDNGNSHYSPRILIAMLERHVAGFYTGCSR
jgi:hypothetical protein